MIRVLFLLAAAALAPPPAAAQSLLERTPNLSGGWIGDRGMLHFHFVHRFNHSGAPTRQVQNRPTLLLAWRPALPVLAGVNYATRSALVGGVPNEWEIFARTRPLAQEHGAPLDAALQLGYNAAARSIDAEATAARRLGRVRLIAGARALSDAADGDGAAVLAVGGAVLRLHGNIALAADIAARRDHDAVWGAALQLRLPLTPHTLSLHVTNADATTLHSASVAGERRRWGFEFTVPVTPARYLRSTATASAPPATGDSAAVVAIHNLRYMPDTLRIRRGTTVEWRNADPLPHSVTAADGSWDSGEILPGRAWRRRFDERGTTAIVCTPHPFMNSVVIVE